MRTKALAILLAASIAAFPAIAEARSQQKSELPQFVSPAAREKVTNAAREANATPVETRKAAEALSAKFSTLSEDDGRNMHAATSVASKSDDLAKSGASSHVAVIVAGKPKAKKLKARSATPARTAGETQHRGARSAKRTQIKARRGPASARHPQTSAHEVPGATTGWQTGLIGLLTNPAFWHSD
jgi:hypothetical protein